MTRSNAYQGDLISLWYISPLSPIILTRSRLTTNNFSRKLELRACCDLKIFQGSDVSEKCGTLRLCPSRAPFQEREIGVAKSKGCLEKLGLFRDNFILNRQFP